MTTAITDVEQTVRRIAEKALHASRRLAPVASADKNAALERLAELLASPETEALLAEANARDLHTAEEMELSEAMKDRLRLTPERMRAMAEGARQVAALPDPVGAVLESRRHAKGFTIEKVRVPLGVVGIIYESRPNVTIDCAILCLKSGNATILRGGREAFHSNRALAELVRRVLREGGLPEDAVQLIPTTDRAALTTLLHADDCIHCLIPRGGEGLIRFVAEEARMPVIKHYKGLCNVYLDREADAETAIRVTVNAKCQRPGVCNAAENLVVHEELLGTVFPRVARALSEEGVLLRGDGAARAACDQVGLPCDPVREEDYATEYLGKILSIRTVGDIGEAIDFINHYGSGHSDAILTENPEAARRFQTEVDAASVYWNVSTRFTDGFEFGLGAEIGISTDKLHARGPMGLTELTSYKYLIRGEGQIK
ncbi:MAG: glutamate-5-semialdehyde dehydrogenase [Verrucomicrobia bacterium]|jgi:glutamate-5-semialdehyde dehydrogenase|nr:glutamate-5-semialdehyde dehydrogenase [Verrucomicrobiota bacterium]